MLYKHAVSSVEDPTPVRIWLSSAFPIFLRRNDVRQIGLNDQGRVTSLPPILGVNVTLTLLNFLGVKSKAKLPLVILPSAVYYSFLAYLYKAWARCCLRLATKWAEKIRPLKLLRRYLLAICQSALLGLPIVLFILRLLPGKCVSKRRRSLLFILNLVSIRPSIPIHLTFCCFMQFYSYWIDYFHL